MGNVSRALQLIIDEENDIKRAVEFCKQTKYDDKLWDELILKATNNPGK